MGWSSEPRPCFKEGEVAEKTGEIAERGQREAAPRGVKTGMWLHEEPRGLVRL